MSSVNKQKKNQKQQQQNKKQNKKMSKAQPHRRKAKSARGPIQSSLNTRRNRGRGGALGLGSGVSGSTSRRAQVIEEDEYIGEVNGSVSFATTSYPLNPGQSGTFPWGYKIAQLYEEYDFDFIEFYYKREVSEFATNGQAGKVILSFDYDASDAAPTTKQQVEDTVPHLDGMPCTPEIRLSLDCSRIRKNPSKYVRPGAQPANTDIKTYDAGNFYISTYGCTNTTVIGELRVRYRCRLAEPVLEAAIVAPSTYSAAHVSTTGNSGTASSPLAGTPAFQVGSTITGTIGPGSPEVYVQFSNCVPTTQYILTATWTGANIAAVPTATINSGATALNYQNSDTQSSTSSFTSTTALLILSFVANAATVKISFGGLTSMTAANADVWIAAIPPALITTPNIQSSSFVEERLARLERMLQNSRIRVDSDFDDDDVAIKSSSSIATSMTDSLSRSTIDLVGELIARKSVSNKK
jgi:hypothetical protein